MESQLQELRRSQDARSTNNSESKSISEMNSRVTGENMDSASVTRRLEEELLKRDALIEVFLCYLLCTKIRRQTIMKCQVFQFYAMCLKSYLTGPESTGHKII